ncbi:hypothetical protein HPB48_004483 [Haemaphysalis longicornis]|uniref:Transposase Tc1-like domain-containing protein n=1 Tax=Haemaphysalis longicornis TaxID=44386 RepID=A0A9J6GGH4_HAELO|nr:hypothetical protein HPB48_004483 [Haemaphysalis longicornis]
MPPRVPLSARQEVPQRDICRRTGTSLTALNGIIQAYRDEDGRLADAPRSGRQRCTCDEVDRLIVAAAFEDPFQSERGIRDALNLNVSLGTIRNRMKDAGLNGCVVAQKPYLTAKQKEQRLAFARAHEQWTVEDRREVVFTDESTFSTRWDQQRRV